MQVKLEGYGQYEEDVQYWVENRKSIKDLYPSEKHFFIPLIQEVESVLDIGCAAGGSALFTRELNPTIRYCGIDNSKNLIQAAQKRFQNVENIEFMTFDGFHIPVGNDSYKLCTSFGVFHHLNHWKDLIAESLRVSSKYVLFDLRLWEQPTLINTEISFQKLALSGVWDNQSIIPYNLISITEFSNWCSELNNKNINCKTYGYLRKPTELAITPAKQVLMLSVLLEKNVANAATHFTNPF